MSDFKKFSAAIKKKDFGKVYLIYGSEDYFVSKAVDLLIESVVEPEQRSFNLDIFDGSEATSEDVLSSVLSFPFVGKYRLTVIRRFDKMERKYRVDVAEHVSSLPESSILCLVAGEIKTSEETYKKISSFADTISFNRLKGTDLTDFMKETASSLGKELGDGALDLLLDLAGDSAGDLASELEKLAMYVGERKKIEVDDVGTVVGKSRAYNIFELQRAIGQKDARRAQEIADKMLETGEKPVYLTFMLTRYFLNLLRVKHLLRKGASTNDISSNIFGRWNPFINEYTSAARAYSIYEIKNAMSVLLDVDSKLKNGGYKDADAIMLLVSEILNNGVPRTT